MKGRKPIPTGIKELRGNPGKRPLNDREPKPPAEIPTCPSHLTGEARKEWNRIVPELKACGVLTKIDRAALAAYCDAYGTWVEANAKMGKSGGLMVKSPNGYPMQNPYLSIRNKAFELMHKFLIEFGMTPSSRSRVQVYHPAEEDKLEQRLKIARSS